MSERVAGNMDKSLGGYGLGGEPETLTRRTDVSPVSKESVVEIAIAGKGGDQA